MPKITDVDRAYARVLTFDDLVRTNVDFIRGRVGGTFYHSGPLDDETAPLVPKLERLAREKRLFTVGGQPALRDVVDVDGGAVETEQKSHLAFLVERDRLFDVLTVADAHGLCYAAYEYESGYALTGGELPANLTRERSAATRDGLRTQPWDECTGVSNATGAALEMLSLTETLPNVHELVRGTVHFDVWVDEYGVGSVEDALMTLEDV